MAVEIHLPYTLNEIPIAKVFDIDDTTFTYEIQYNNNFDFYTLYVKDESDNIIYSTKLVYGNDAFHAFDISKRPDKRLKPYNVIETIDLYNEDNFDKVKLYVID